MTRERASKRANEQGREVDRERAHDGLGSSRRTGAGRPYTFRDCAKAAAPRIERGGGKIVGAGGGGVTAIWHARRRLYVGTVSSAPPGTIEARDPHIAMDTGQCSCTSRAARLQAAPRADRRHMRVGTASPSLSAARLAHRRRGSRGSERDGARGGATQRRGGGGDG